MALTVNGGRCCAHVHDWKGTSADLGHAARCPVGEQLTRALLVRGARNLQPIGQTFGIVYSVRRIFSGYKKRLRLRCRVIADTVANATETLFKVNNFIISPTEQSILRSNKRINLVHSNANSVILIGQVLNNWSVRKYIVERTESAHRTREILQAVVRGCKSKCFD